MNLLLLYSICGLLLFLTIYKQRKCWYFIWHLNGWRGLMQQPVLWLLLIIYLEPKSIMSSIQRSFKYFQFPLAIIVFNRILLCVDDPATMEGVLTGPECLNKTFLQNGFYANKGLLHAKDEQWKIRRKQLNPAFSHNTLISFFEVFNRIANELKLKISNDLKGSKVKFKNLEDLISRAVLEVSCITTMGYETNFLKHDGKCIAQTYMYLMEITALRILRPWYQVEFIFRLLDNENYEKSKRANKLVNEFVENIVQQKFIQWQHKHGLQQKLDIRNPSCDWEAANKTMKDETQLNEHRENNIFIDNTTTAITDALKNIEEEIVSMPKRNVNTSGLMPKQQQQRIFIDQIFYLAQTGKLTLPDVMNESQSMIAVAFETVSRCIINALLCLAINHECQLKLRQEIKEVLKYKMNMTKNSVPTKHTNDSIRKSLTNMNKTCANTIDDDFDATANAYYKCDGNNSSRCNSEYDDSDDVAVTMDDLLNMPYLDMIINESLRLLPTIPMNLRNVSADFQLNVISRDKFPCKMKNTNNANNYAGASSSGCRRCVIVPKDTIIALDIFNMQRNELYWGTNALKFDPEHFSKKSTQQQNKKVGNDEGGEQQQQINQTRITSTTTSTSTLRHPYSFIPFSKGLRTCIGYRYSIYLSKIMLIKLISSFDFYTDMQLQDLQYYEGVSLKYRNADEINFQIHSID